jgi:DNA-binding NtrC family response regulator
LRDRGDDVLLLASYFLQKFARSMQRDLKRLSPEAARALCDYDWPGNVRELEHAIEHAMVLSQKEVITPADLPFTRQPSMLRESGTTPGVGPARVAPSTPATEPDDPGAPLLSELAGLPYAEAKRRLVAHFDETYTGELLRKTGGNMSEAARQAGLDRSNFRRLLKRHKDDE